MLEDSLGSEVDVTTRDSLQPMLRDDIENVGCARVLMKRKIEPILHEIIAAIDGINTAVTGKTFADFQKDWLLRHEGASFDFVNPIEQPSRAAQDAS